LPACRQKGASFANQPHGEPRIEIADKEIAGKEIAAKEIADNDVTKLGRWHGRYHQQQQEKDSKLPRRSERWHRDEKRRRQQCNQRLSVIGEVKGAGTSTHSNTTAAPSSGEGSAGIVDLCGVAASLSAHASLQQPRSVGVPAATDVDGDAVWIYRNRQGP
jgi:hypothetical protein